LPDGGVRIAISVLPARYRPESWIATETNPGPLRKQIPAILLSELERLGGKGAGDLSYKNGGAHLRTEVDGMVISRDGRRTGCGAGSAAFAATCDLKNSFLF